MIFGSVGHSNDPRELAIGLCVRRSVAAGGLTSEMNQLPQSILADDPPFLLLVTGLRYRKYVVVDPNSMDVEQKPFLLSFLFCKPIFGCISYDG